MEIEELAKRISAGYASLSGSARAARGTDGLIQRIEKRHLGVKVCAVDGGLLAHRMHGTDIVIVRAAAAIFSYKDSGLASFDYHPSKNPRPSIEMEASLDEHEAIVFRSLVRLKHELTCALEALEKHSPGMLLLDGSLLMLPSDRPPGGSALMRMHDGVTGLTERLFEMSHQKDCMLCGVIKDSRSRKLAKRLGFSCSDSVLCDFLLDAKERTGSMLYSEDGPGRMVNVFYMKPSENDLPLRIELLGDKADEAASLLLSLSAISENFAYPAVLIEADMCAALDPREMEPIESSLRNLAGIRPLRRNLRPFR